MRSILAEIRDGRFAEEWRRENEGGSTTFRELVATDVAHPIETTGRQLRASMAWLDAREEART